MSELRVLLVGDVVMQSEWKFSDTLTQLFSKAHIKCCNFEAPVTGVGTPILKAGPLVTQSVNAPKWIMEKGFAVINFANNHIMDYGKDALYNSLNLFQNVVTVGVGNFTEAYGLKVVEQNEVKVGFLSFGENSFGALADEFDQKGYAWINHPIVNQLIAESKRKVDVLIVQCHAGVELMDVPLPEWRARYRELIDHGADAVIAHHPHISQGIENYKSAPIFYSLGNFYFDYPSTHPAWNKGMLAEIKIENKKLVSYVPHLVERKENTIYLSPQEETKNEVERLNELLAEKYYENVLNKNILDLWEKGYVKYYEKAVTGISQLKIIPLLKHIKRIVKGAKTDYTFLWHNIHIESNRWLAQRAINLKFKKRF